MKMPVPPPAKKARLLDTAEPENDVFLDVASKNATPSGRSRALGSRLRACIRVQRTMLFNVYNHRRLNRIHQVGIEYGPCCTRLCIAILFSKTSIPPFSHVTNFTDYENANATADERCLWGRVLSHYAEYSNDAAVYAYAE